MMPSRNVILAAAIVIAVAFTALLTKTVIGPRPTESSARHVIRVRVATADLPRGALIQTSDLAWTEVERAPDENQVMQGRDPDDKLIGAVVRLPLTRGQPIEQSRIVLPDAPDFLAAALDPGKRAVSLAINDVSGNAGLIQPGDHVDILLTQHFEGANRGMRDVVGETVLTNLRIIAVGRQFSSEKKDAKDPKGQTNTAARTVTFEVDAEQAERIVVASQLGDLSLALRSLAAETGHVVGSDGTIVRKPVDEARKPPLVSAADVSEAAAARLRPVEAHPVPPEPAENPPPPMPVKVFRGSIEGN